MVIISRKLYPRTITNKNIKKIKIKYKNDKSMGLKMK
jgi:hypothetical protein